MHHGKGRMDGSANASQSVRPRSKLPSPTRDALTPWTALQRGNASSAGRSPGSSVLAVHLPARRFGEQWCSAALARAVGRPAPIYRCGGSAGIARNIAPPLTGFPFHPPRGSARRTPAGRHRSENSRAWPCNAGGAAKRGAAPPMVEFTSPGIRPRMGEESSH